MRAESNYAENAAQSLVHRLARYAVHVPSLVIQAEKTTVAPAGGTHPFMPAKGQSQSTPPHPASAPPQPPRRLLTLKHPNLAVMY
jgi:hypothetical protein